MPQDFTGKSAIVTGGASGLGLAMAEGLLAAGANVVAADLSEPAADQVAPKGGGKLVSRRCDVSDETEVEALVAACVEEFGGLDLLCNNAGISGVEASLHEYPTADWDQVMAVDLRAPFLVLKHSLAAMRGTGGGAIVNTASVGGFKATSGFPAYTTAKAGVIMLTRQAAAEYMADGIRVNAIAPGIMDTPILAGLSEELKTAIVAGIPAGRLGVPADAAALALFLLSDGAGYITGQTYVIDGGFSASARRPVPRFVMSSSAREWSTAIAEVRADDVVVRGYQLSDLVGAITFTDAIFLVNVGVLPTPEARKMLDAILVSTIEHGISPSTVLARILASCGTPLQASVAGGVLSIADHHGGTGEQVGELLAELVESGPTNSRGERIAALVHRYGTEGRRFEGFGHPQHPEGDPRVTALLKLAEELGVTGSHVDALEELAAAISSELGRELAPNVTGALAAVALDLGFSSTAVRGLVISARVPGLVAHVAEEREQGGRWRHADVGDVEYVGPRGRTLSEAG